MNIGLLSDVSNNLYEYKNYIIMFLTPFVSAGFENMYTERVRTTEDINLWYKNDEFLLFFWSVDNCGGC